MSPKRNSADLAIAINNLELEQVGKLEIRPTYIKTGVMLMLATLGISGYIFYNKMTKKDNLSFADINIIPIEEISPTAQASGSEKDSPLDIYYPQLEKYDRMTIEEFERQPLDERLAFSHYLIDRTEQDGTYNKYYKIGTEGYNFATGLSPVDINTPDWVIIDNYLHTRQLSMLQFDKNSNGNNLLNKTDSKKILSSIYYKTDDYTPPQYQDIKSDIDLMKPPAILAIKFMALQSTPLLGGDRTVNNHTEHITYKEMDFYDREAAMPYSARFILVKYHNYDGTEKETWLLDAISEHKDGLSPIN